MLRFHPSRTRTLAGRSVGYELYYALQRAKGIAIETDLRPYERVVREVRRLDFTADSDVELLRRATVLKERSAGDGAAAASLPEAYALVCEACRRELHQDPFDVQLLAAVVLHSGKLAQMNTGEGKTLAAIFPAFLDGLTGLGVHVLTANDYLARRDARWMGGVLRRLGLTVGYINDTSPFERRRIAYRRDVTYLTARQAGFDFLTDGLAYRAENLIQRAPHMAIVDEADFILVDEARVPLVVASASGRLEIDPHRADRVARALDAGVDYSVDKVGRNCILTERGERRVAHLMCCGGMHEEAARSTYAAVHVALHAHVLLTRDVHYVVKNEKVELVDEFTGRIAENRRWPYGIQTALEVKEGVPVRSEGRVAGSITVQNLIRRYPRLAALSATAVPAAAELVRSYGLATVIIPPNRGERTVHLPDRVFASKEGKLRAVTEEIGTAHATGRPILVGTRSVRESEELAERLKKAGIRCRVLNAKNDRREAGLVARAGMIGAVTISTNMAGRGTDIKLGGEEGVDRERLLDLGGLYVIGTNRHESVRVDNQLRGRAGRQGDPGLTRFFVSLEDELFSRYGIPEFLPRRMLENRAGELIDRRVDREVTRAQAIIEEQYSEMRRTLRNYAELVEVQRKIFETTRRGVLLGERFPSGYGEACEEHRKRVAGQIGEAKAFELLRFTLLATLDTFWSDHLAFVDDLREGIHLQRYARRDPLLVFIQEVSDVFDDGLESAVAGAAERFRALEPAVDLTLPAAAELQGPSSTWTYAVNDDPFPAFSLSMVAHADLGAAVMMTFQAAVFGPFVLLAAGIQSLVRLLRRRPLVVHSTARPGNEVGRSKPDEINGIMATTARRREERDR